MLSLPEMETLLRNLDARIGRIEQILPTLATKDELQAAIAPLATRDEMHAAIQAAVAPLATREEMRAAIKEEGERTRRHFDVVAESLRDDIRLLAESQVTLLQRMDRLESRG